MLIESGNADFVCVLKKTYEGSELLLVFVTDAQGAVLDLSGVTLGADPVGEQTQVRARLTTGEEEIRWDNGRAEMPGFSVLVLK